MSLTSARRGQRILLGFGALVAVLGPVFIYYDTFTNKFGFVGDDFTTMGIFGAQSFSAVVRSFFGVDVWNYYRPFHQLFGWTFTQIGGPSRHIQAGGGFLLHLGAVWALYHAAARLSRSRVTGMLTAALWSMSTVQLHAFLSPPALIPERLCALAIAASMAVFLGRFWKLAPLAMGIGLLSKEWAAMIPFILTALWALILAGSWEQTGRIRGTLALRRGWGLAACWLVVLVYVGLQAHFGSLRPGSALTLTALARPGETTLTNKTWGQVWTGFLSDNEMDLLRSFEFVLWPVLPGHTFPSLTVRASAPSQLLCTAIAFLVLFLPCDLISLLRSRKPAILRPATYFCIAWFALSTMPLSLLSLDSNKPYLPMLPSMALFWFLASMLRRLQKAALPGLAVPFFCLITAGCFGSLVCWYPHGIAQSLWARQRLSVAGRLQEICEQIGDFPRTVSNPSIVLIGLSPGSSDAVALQGRCGLSAFYRRPVGYLSVWKRTDLWAESEGGIRIKKTNSSLAPGTFRIFEKVGDRYVDVTSSVLQQKDSQASPGGKSEETNLAPFAKATASSVFQAYGNYGPDHVKDNTGADWAAATGGKAAIGTWVQLTWDRPMRIHRVELEGRIGGGHILAAHLVFSDGGTTVPVQTLPADGAPLEVTFEPRKVTFVRLVVDDCGPFAVGLREFRVFGE